MGPCAPLFLFKKNPGKNEVNVKMGSSTKRVLERQTRTLIGKPGDRYGTSAAGRRKGPQLVKRR